MQKFVRVLLCPEQHVQDGTTANSTRTWREVETIHMLRCFILSVLLLISCDASVRIVIDIKIIHRLYQYEKSSSSICLWYWYQHHWMVIMCTTFHISFGIQYILSCQNAVEYKIARVLMNSWQEQLTCIASCSYVILSFLLYFGIFLSLLQKHQTRRRSNFSEEIWGDNVCFRARCNLPIHAYVVHLVGHFVSDNL